MIREWRVGDFQRIELQDAQAYLYGMDEMQADITPLADAGMAWTMENDGVVIGCAGIIPQWGNRAMVWAMISRHAGGRMTEIHRAVKRFLESSTYRRIEATVDLGFPEGVKWLKMLGFEYEGLMRSYRPDGADMMLFARVR